MNKHLVTHGDGVKDVAFYVENCKAIYDYSTTHDGIPVYPPTELSDENGTVIVSSIKTYGDTTHTFIENVNYKGIFLPGYKAHHFKEAYNSVMDPVKFQKIDHIVGNQDDLKMEPAVKYYENALGFHRFWSVDD